MTPNIPGADSIVALFEKWPSFHDAEIISAHVNRGAVSTVSITLVEGHSDCADKQNVISSLIVDETLLGELSFTYQVTN